MIPISRPKTGPEELAAIKEVFDSAWLGLGKTVFDFEQALADFLGAKHVIAVNTGTSALHLALDAAGVGPGDEVILPSITFAAAVQPILTLGAIPVFCESREEDLWMDVEDAKKRITPKTKALFPVHYCGSVGDIDVLYTLARQNNLRVVEDAAHAFGSSRDGRMIGSFGDLVFGVMRFFASSTSSRS